MGVVCKNDSIDIGKEGKTEAQITADQIKKQRLYAWAISPFLAQARVYQQKERQFIHFREKIISD